MALTDMKNEEPREYDPSAVERKWQRRWDEQRTNRFTEAELRAAERPYYNLMMFPYPSAEGLHVGNIYAFAGADVHGRFRRLQGERVFEPIGFDAFARFVLNAFPSFFATTPLSRLRLPLAVTFAPHGPRSRSF